MAARCAELTGTWDTGMEAFKSGAELHPMMVTAQAIKVGPATKPRGPMRRMLARLTIHRQTKRWQPCRGHIAAPHRELGRRLAIVRVYYRLGEKFPDQPTARIMAAGSTLLVSLDTIQGGASYSSITAGHHDAAILGFLRAVNRSASRYHLPAIYIAFEHEANDPATHSGLGTPHQFIEAWDHVRLAMTAPFGPTRPTMGGNGASPT